MTIEKSKKAIKEISNVFCKEFNYKIESDGFCVLLEKKELTRVKIIKINLIYETLESFFYYDYETNGKQYPNALYLEELNTLTNILNK